MKAAVLEKLNEMVVKDIEEPKVGDNEILVRVRSCAVCGSDIRIYHYGNPRVNPPQIIGHEIAGDVVAVGKNVTKFSVGERVAVGADVPCGRCKYCQNGLGNNCAINYAIGYQFPGGFAEYILLNQTTVDWGPVHKIPDNLSYDEACLAEPLACCINGLELSKVNLGDVVVIIGAGPAGCLLVQLAKIMGAGKVIISQRSKERLEIAQKFQPDVIIQASGEEFIKKVLAETDGEGADVVIVACPSGEAQETTLKIIKNRGRINFFGGLPRGKSEIKIDSNIVHYKECFIHGSHGCVPRHHKMALDLLANSSIKVNDLISHHFGLNDILEGFSVVEERKGMKVIIHP